MINYIVQIIFFQILFLAVYDLFLQKETFFKWNRAYLLVTPILSFIIPLLKFESLQKTVPQEYVILLPEVVLNLQKVIEQPPNSAETFNYLNLLFYIGIVVVSVLFLVKLYRIIQLIISNTIIRKENYTLILLNNQPSAFSFFNYIFVDRKLIEKGELHIVKHELVHSKQYHTIDLLFFELFKILMWFNPMIYIYQKRITLLHEYISDAEVVKETDKTTYFNNLLATTFNVENISFINQFYKHSLIKKRIIMITKNKSQKMKQLKYLVLIPLLASMLFYTSCTNDIDSTIQTIEKNIDNKDVATNGSYFRGGNNGLILFMGSSLKGKIIPFEEYTEHEKKLYNKMKDASKNNGFRPEFSIVINEVGERVFFVKVKSSKKDFVMTETEEVPFAIIDKSPVFTGCEDEYGKNAKDCLNRGIRKYVGRNFDIKLAENLGLIGKQKIYVKFKITKTGDIEIMGARAPHKELEDEARRVVNSLPKMIPGEYNGRVVNVTYMLPITFDVKE